MRNLPVKLPVPSIEPRGNHWREAIFFLIAFGAMFGAAWLGFDLLATIV